MDRQRVRQRIEQARIAKGWSQRQFAETAGLSPSHVTNLLTRLTNPRARPSSETIAALAKAAGVSREWLLGEVDSGGPGDIVGGTPLPVGPPLPARDDRYACAKEVIAKLVEARGLDPHRARELVGGIAFDEGAGYSSALDLYEMALQALADERGKAFGHREVTDDDDL